MAIDLYEQAPNEDRKQEIIRIFPSWTRFEEILLASRLDHVEKLDALESVDLWLRLGRGRAQRRRGFRNCLRSSQAMLACFAGSCATFSDALTTAVHLSTPLSRRRTVLRSSGSAITGPA